MFDVAVWGTVAAWVGSVSSGGALMTAATYYILDLRRSHKSQAEQVVCWLHPNEHGPFEAHIKNFSDHPVFDLSYEVVGRSDKEVRKELDDNGVASDYPLKKDRDAGFGFSQLLVDYHDHVDFSPGQHLDKIPDVPNVGMSYYHIYFVFKDTAGRTWRRDARTGHFVGRRRSKAIRRQIENYHPTLD